MSHKTYRPTAPILAPTAHSPVDHAHSTHDGRVDTLDNMTDLEKVMTFPWVRMGDYQAFQEQKQGMSVLLRRILMGANDTDRETQFFLGILRAASDIDDDLTSAMRQAREGVKARIYRATPKAQTRIGLPQCYTVRKRSFGTVVALKVRPGHPRPGPDHAPGPHPEERKSEEAGGERPQWLTE